MTEQRDAKIESFFTAIVGCPFKFVEAIRVDKIEAGRNRQASRLLHENPDYVSGIAHTMSTGAYIPPVIVTPYHKDTFEIVDGMHRLLAAKQIKRSTLSAYVIDANDAITELISSCVNVYLNGQGLSEEERRLQFLAMARRQFTDLARANVRDKLLKRNMAVLAVSSGTATRWIAIEVFRSRADRLGLKMPAAVDAKHLTGRKTDAWTLAVARFSDEELVKFWPQLTTAPASAVQKIAVTLEDCTSTQQRASKADIVIAELHPTIRVMSQTQADKDRRSANQIRSHGAGLLKIAPAFQRLAAKYDDVRSTLNALRLALEETTQDGIEETSAASAR